MSETVYARSPDVVWRLGPDRVLVRRVGGRGEHGAADLIGEAALAWLAVDEAGSLNEINERLSQAGFSLIESGLMKEFLACGWIRASM